MKVFGQLEAAQFENLAADPTGVGLVLGRVWFNTTDSKYRGYDGSSVIEFADLTSAQTFQNKTLEGAVVSDYLEFDQVVTPANPASGKNRIYFKSDGVAYTLDENGNEVPLGSGGGGSKNYFSDVDANIDSTIGGWETDDGAGSPSAGLTLSVTSVAGELLAGANSLKLVKDAADRNGHFIKVGSETIDPSDRGRANYGSFEFRPGTGYVGSDLIFEVYDVTNAVVLYSGVMEDLEILDSKGRFEWVSYLADTTEQVEFRIKVNNTNTNTFEAFFDEFKFGPAAILNAPIITEWQDYNIVIGADPGPAPTVNGGTIVDSKWRRVGDTAEIYFSLRQSAAGTSGTGTYTFSLPPGLQIDNDKLFSSPGFGTQGIVGPAAVSAGAQFSGYVQAYQNNTLIMYAGNASLDPALVSGSYADLGNAALRYTFTARVPIVGWGAGAVLTGNELSQQTIRAEVHRVAPDQNILSNTGTTIEFNGSLYDTHGIVDLAQFGFVIPKDGFYKINASLSLAAITTDERVRINIGVNGSNVAQGIYRSGPTDTPAQITKMVQLSKGDVVTSFSDTDADNNYLVRSGLNLSYMTIESAPDFTVLGAVRNDELVQIVSNTFYSQAGGSLNTYYVPTTAFSIDLTEGTWDIDINVAMDLVTTGGNAAAFLALSTSSTPGAGIFAETRSTASSNNGSINRATMGIYTVKNYVVTSPQTIYVQIQARNVSAATGFTTLGFGGNSIVDGVLAARRVK